MNPIAEADRYDGPGLSHELVPGMTAVIENGAVGEDDLPPEKWTPDYADFASACSGVI
jgi:hypothetical protein